MTGMSLERGRFLGEWSGGEPKLHFPKNRPVQKKNLSFQSFSSGNHFVAIIAQNHWDVTIIAGI
jgi:hypothetical protein